jgi:hypothetical protein
MKRTIVLLFALCVVVGLAAPALLAQENPQSAGKNAAGAKEARWHGIIVRTSKDQSYFDVHRQNVDKRIYFDSSTKWTKMNKPADQSEFKEGADVICLGQYDEKKEFHATRIDLRIK